MNFLQVSLLHGIFHYHVWRDLNCAFRHHICVYQKRPPEFEYFGGHVKLSLPESVDPMTIPIIEASLNQYTNFYGLRGPLADMILEQGYIPQLLDQFKIAKDLDNQELIGSIFNIFRCLVLLSNKAIFEYLFSANIAVEIASVFESTFPNICIADRICR